jgi:hypothetical protein
MPGWKGLAAFAVVVAGGVGGFAVYTFGWHDNGGRGQTAGVHHVYTLRDGDIAVRPSASTRCLASREAGSAIHIHSAEVNGEQWRTPEGLRVGVSAEVIRHLYPAAIFQRGPRPDLPFGPTGPAYWLVHVREKCVVGVCARPFETVVRLSANVRSGRVAGFYFPVRAEGE